MTPPTESFEKGSSIPLGTSREQLIESFGLPECRIKNNWFYRRKTGKGEEQLLLSFKRGKVSRIRGSFRPEPPME